MQYDICIKCTEKSVLIAALAPYGLTVTDESGQESMLTASLSHALSYAGRVIQAPAVIDISTGGVTDEAMYWPGEYAVLRGEEALLREIAGATMDGVEVLTAPPAGCPTFGGWRVLPAVDIQAARAGRLAAIRAACDAALDPLAASYPDREVQSWPQQIAEATGLESDPLAAAPLIRQMAAARPSLGETQDERVAELARRIRANATAWSEVAGPIIGQRQALEDAVIAATTVEEVMGINIESIGGAS